jgi:NAD(P)-dependent dehydrogenase (short-subunit alcohol dehydrogenase family)
MSAAARRANEGLDLTGKTAVITGASQGIGAGVAVRFAQAGANVIIVGRSEQRLKKVVEAARKAAKSPTQHIEYISADLSLISSIKSVVSKIESSSNRTVDFLVQTQGGTPNGLYETTSEGIEVHFATQVLGRFAVAYLLASSGILKGTSVNIMAPGGSEKEFNLDDIELASHKSSSRLSQMGQAASRDGVITDSYTKALQSLFPQNKFFHVFPGFVSTNVMVNQNTPFLIKYLVTYILYPIAALTFGNSVQSYADLPVFLAANERSNSLADAEGYYLDNKNKKASLSPYALSEVNQQAVFEKLKAYIDA